MRKQNGRNVTAGKARAKSSVRSTLFIATRVKSKGRSPNRPRPSGFGLRPSKVVVLAMALLALTIGCGKQHEPTAATGESLPPASVRVEKIETVKQPAMEEVVGTVEPKLQAVIEAKVSGRITRLPVTVGQTVKQGDVLVELATEEIRAKLDQATAAFRQAELDFNRVSNLRQQSAATQADARLILGLLYSRSLRP